MASQYVVIYFPDATLNVRAVGPFRSRVRADEAVERLRSALDSHDTELHPSRLPNVVELMSVDGAIELDVLGQLGSAELAGDVCPWCHHVLYQPDKCPHCEWRRPVTRL